MFSGFACICNSPYKGFCINLSIPKPFWQNSFSAMQKQKEQRFTKAKN
jgi:hypothetical protein